MAVVGEGCEVIGRGGMRFHLGLLDISSRHEFNLCFSHRGVAFIRAVVL
jgi:hypothetical protein